MSIVYGPVPSWRLGRSLGIDLISAAGKTCTFDCIYCQLGQTIHLNSERQAFVETDRLEAELANLPPIVADYVTFSGTGEPTLAANLGDALKLVRRAPALLGTPTAVLTNASLMSRPVVRCDLALADLVVAKLDAPDEELFQVLNQPITGIGWAEVVKGIRAFRREFAGRLALQMMFVANNQSRAKEMATLARNLGVDEIQINTPLRPSPTPPLSRSEMAEIKAAFAGLPVFSVYDAQPPQVKPLDRAEMQRRRPAEGNRATPREEVN